jgi:coenzyme F420-0:L-glutamate ligase/coenzyme F420-1:gamma-L-glutamate ligase
MEDRSKLHLPSSILILMPLSRNIGAFIRAARVAHLATADAKRQPLVVPVCFAFDGEEFFSPIDEKPKRLAPQKLRRLRNIEQNPHVSLVIDRYKEDWRKLAYILVSGNARILLTGQKHRRGVRLLRRKYPQYHSMAIEDRPMIVIRPAKVKVWGRL